MAKLSIGGCNAHVTALSQSNNRAQGAHFRWAITPFSAYYVANGGQPANYGATVWIGVTANPQSFADQLFCCQTDFRYRNNAQPNQQCVGVEQDWNNWYATGNGGGRIC